MIGALLFTLLLALLFAAIVWGISLRLEDVSIADMLWGPLFIIMSWVALAHSYPSSRHWLLAILVSVWGVRLAVHIYLRHEGEDARYTRMREKHGEAFRMSSLYLVFALQAGLAWVISMPVQIALLLDDHAFGELSPLDTVGILFFVFGFLVETIADGHLLYWKRNPQNLGKVLDRGLWAFSRHPNYFGEMLVWWGLYLIAAASGWGAIAIWGPALLTYLLLKVSGVPMLEAELARRKPAYAAYVARTSAFWPRPPKGPPVDALSLDPEDAPTEEKAKPQQAAAIPAVAKHILPPVQRKDPATIEISIPPPSTDVEIER